MSMTILYEVGNNLYVNLTNKCPCSCTFCIRNNGDGAYGSDSLWLEHDPEEQEILKDFEKRVLIVEYGDKTSQEIIKYDNRNLFLLIT